MRTYHSFLPDDRHPVLHTIHSVRDLGEVILAQGLLAHIKGAVVCARHTEVITSKEKKHGHVGLFDFDKKNNPDLFL